MKRAIPVFALLAAAIALSACRPNDGLDDRLKAMESRVSALEQSNADLSAQLNAANAPAPDGTGNRAVQGGLDDRGAGAGLDDRATGDQK